jgi:hypothetical protein
MIENMENTIEELDKIMGNLNLGEATDHSDFSKNFSRSIAADFTTRVSNNVHQVCVITTEAAEDNDGMENMIVSAQGGNPRNNHRKEKEKIYVSAGEWKIIMSAINHSMGIPMDSRREVLMGYQYALHQHKKKLLEEKSELRRSQENNSTSSRFLWEEYSEMSESSEERHRQPKHNRRRTEWPNKEDSTKSINLANGTQTMARANGVEGTNWRIRHRTSIHVCWQWYKPNICKNFKGNEYITGLVIHCKRIYNF